MGDILFPMDIPLSNKKFSYNCHTLNMFLRYFTLLRQTYHCVLYPFFCVCGKLKLAYTTLYNKEIKIRGHQSKETLHRQPIKMSHCTTQDFNYK